MNARALLLDLIFGYGFVSAEAARQCLDEFLKIEGFKKRFPPLRSAPAGWSPFALQREQNHRRLYENHDHP
jgi:hypothetical protein